MGRSKPIAMVAAGMLAGWIGGSQALAATPAYVGKWAIEPAQCRVAQSARNAPLILKTRTYDQYESHCQFTGIKQTGPGVWEADATCVVEGGKQKHAFTFAVTGDDLIVTDEAGKRTFRRCR